MSGPFKSRVYEFEEFRLDAAHSMLYRNGREVSLPPKAVETLHALVAARGKILSKDELMAIVWPDSVVEESNLSQYLHLIRKTLGETKARKPFIQTLRRRGYRFTAEVSVKELSFTDRSDAGSKRQSRSVISVESKASIEAVSGGRSSVPEKIKTAFDVADRESTYVLAGQPILGREKEIAEIVQWLMAREARLLTLTGVGGVGKTTLARILAECVRHDFTDGVFFVELAQIRYPEIVVSTIASTLGVREAAGGTTLEALKHHLQDRRVLLILDNFEQVISAAGILAELIAATHNLKILVTSRVFLHLSMEREFVVPPLAVPSQNIFANSKAVWDSAAAGSDLLLDDVQRSPAVRLFIDRAKNVKKDFALTSENAQSVVEICARLQGLPLAIELAAARIKILSPAGILARLDNQLNLLTGGARDLPARQQTIRATIAWSYDLLEQAQKHLFRRLAVFAGGFTLEAAEAVAKIDLPGKKKADPKRKFVGVKDISTADILNNVTSLVEQNLLASREQANGELRFYMLEVVREYALELLKASAEFEAMFRRHAEYFLSLGKEAEPHLQAARSGDWLNRFEEDHDNLRSALDWSAQNDRRTGELLATAIWRFWLLHGHIREGRDYLEFFLSQKNTDVEKGVRTKMLLGAGYLNQLAGNFDRARALAQEGLALARQTGNKSAAAFSLYQLGLLALDEDIARAGQLFEEGLSYAKDSGDKQILALLFNGLGEFARSQNDYRQAADLYEQALELNRETGDLYRQATNLVNLGATALSQKDLKAAGSYYRDGLKVSSDMSDVRGTIYCLEGVACSSWLMREPERAALLLGAAAALRETMSLPIEPADRQLYDNSVASVSKLLSEKAFANSFAAGGKLNLKDAIKLALDDTVYLTSFEKTDSGIRQNHINR